MKTVIQSVTLSIGSSDFLYLSLSADFQLDALETIRAAARLVCPANVADKTAIEFYPEITVRI